MSGAALCRDQKVENDMIQPLKRYSLRLFALLIGIVNGTAEELTEDRV